MARRGARQDQNPGRPNTVALTSAVTDQGGLNERERRHRRCCRRRGHALPRRLRFPSAGSCDG